ncbi:MvaI/BcnI family restriction endonuclease [Candidatus Bathyarchaeota archaeon]|nr:MvaI/BcnI family restriction endonuclease [Candidatus Bathyarchaeota archaeon]
MEYPEFQRRIAQIKGMGYVLTHRKGDTGIGKTLEDLLGITENNIAGPDFATYELKAGRKESVSMLTLFTKAPSPASANKRLLEVFGYAQRKVPRDYRQLSLAGKEAGESNIPVEDKELHVTVDALKPNSVGLKLGVREKKLIIENDRGVEAYWYTDTLRESFERKYHRLVYVLADHKMEGGKEHFWFNETLLLDDFGFERFSELVGEGRLKVDIRIGHYPDGRLHDHGTGFRILPKYLPQCFKTINRVI